MARATGPDPADGLGWAGGRRLSIGAEPACWAEGCIGVGAGGHGPGVRRAVRGRPVGSPKGLPNIHLFVRK